jgi:hypothetical protein
VLADRARESLRRLGYTTEPNDTAYGFDVYADYLDNIAHCDPNSRCFSQVRAGRPSALQFWYRQSPRPLIPLSARGRVDPLDPAPVQPGMIAVKLDSSGRLIGLEAVPLAVPPAVASVDDGTAIAMLAPAPTKSIDKSAPTTRWEALLEAAELDPNDLEPTAPTGVPTVFADQRVAWEGHYPDEPRRPVAVEAAAYEGRPVYFRVRDPFTKTDLRAGASGRSASSRARQMVMVPLILAGLVGATLLARRNLQRGRGDRVGAVRVGVATFVISLLATALSCSLLEHPVQGFTTLLAATGLALLFAFWFGLTYLAFEPYVRSCSPDSLISWTRLLAGRVRDPLVGRDVLIGCAVGAVLAVLTQVQALLPGLLGCPQMRPLDIDLAGLGNTRSALALFLRTSFLGLSLFYVFMFVIIRLLLRSWVAALAVFWLFFTAVDVVGRVGAATPASIAAAGTVAGIIVAVRLFVLFRHGLLALVVSAFVAERLLSFPITLDRDTWYAAIAYGAMLALAALAICAFRLALAGQSLFEEEPPPLPTTTRR